MTEDQKYEALRKDFLELQRKLEAQQQAQQPQTVLIEQTSKRYKAQIAGGFCLMTLGFVVSSAWSAGIGSLMILAGLVLWLGGGIGKWWHHE